VVDDEDVTSVLSIAQDNPGTTPSSTNLRMFPNGANLDLLRLEFLWPSADPGDVTLTPIGTPESYADRHPTAQDVLERSIGSTLLSTSTFGGAPGIPVVPTPGVLALLSVGGLAVLRRRR